MEVGERFRGPSKSWNCRSLQLVLLILTTVIVATRAQNTCSSNTQLPADIAANFTTDICNDQVWTAYNYVLRFEENTTSQVLTVVLSVPEANRWYGIGFNSQAQMVGSSAIVFWPSSDGTRPYVNTYYLSKEDASGVLPDNTRLSYTTMPSVTVENNFYYLTFQVNRANSTASFQSTVLAVGAINDLPKTTGFSNSDQHSDQNPDNKINYQSGATSVVHSNAAEIAKAHGILNIIGWGVLLPVGAIIARYARGYDPTWFYLHAGIQILGYIFVIAGLATGFEADSKFPYADDGSHEALGIVIFVLATLQVSAVLIRPNKDAKIRRFWNWGHWTFGRVALFLGAVNIFLGIHVANSGNKWRASYGIILAIEILLVLVLEAVLWLRYFRKRDAPQLPQTAMSRRGPAYDDPANPPRAFGSANWDN